MVKKLLVVAADQSVHDLVAATLRSDDRLQILIAVDGEEALKIARQEQPDLLLLDLVMPKRDGFEVCLALQSDPATSKAIVVFLTAVDQHAELERAKSLGVTDYCTKPFSPPGLLRKVDELLGD